MASPADLFLNPRLQNAQAKFGVAQNLLAQGPAGNPQAYSPLPVDQPRAEIAPPEMTVQQAQDRTAPPLGQSFSAGVEQTKSMVKNALAGAAATVGQDAFSERMRNDATKNNARAAELMQNAGAPTSLKDVWDHGDFGDFGQYMAHAVARGLPQIAAMGAGAALTRGRSAFGQAVGTAAPSLVMNYGDTYNQGMDTVDEMVRSGQLDPAHAKEAKQRVLANSAVAAPIMAMLDSTGFGTMFKTGLARKEFAHALADSFPSHLKKAILTEGGTEAVQQYVQNAAVKQALQNPQAFGITEDDAWQMADAFAQGSAMGGAMAPVGHIGAPIGAAARGATDLAFKGIEQGGKLLGAGKEKAQEVVQGLTPGEGGDSIGTKMGRGLAKVFDGEPGSVKEAANAVLGKLEELPFVKEGVAQGKDFFEAVGKSERLGRAASLYQKYEPAVEQSFKSFMTRAKAAGQAFAEGFDEGADLGDYKDLYNKYRDLFLRSVPTDVSEAQIAKGLGEKAGAWADGVGEFLAGSEARLAAFAKGAYEGTKLDGWKTFGRRLVEDVGGVVTPEAMQAAGKVAGQTVSKAGDVATQGHDLTKSYAGAAINTAADVATSPMAKSVTGAIGNTVADVAELATQKMAEAYQGFRDGKISAEEAIAKATEDIPPDNHPPSASESERLAKSLVTAAKTKIVGADGQPLKLSVLGGSRDRPLFEAFVKAQAPNVPKLARPTLAAMLEHLVNNAPDFEALLQNDKDADPWANRLFGMSLTEVRNRLLDLTRKQDKPSTAEVIAEGSTPMAGAFQEALQKKQIEEANAPVNETEGLEPTDRDNLGLSETEGLNQTGTNNPFMDEATFEAMKQQRRNKRGTQSQVQLTRTRYDANGSPTGEAATEGHTVNMMNIARAYSRRRRLSDDQGVYGKDRQNRNFLEGMSGLLGGWRNELPDGGYEEVAVQPARGAGNALGSTPQEALTPELRSDETTDQFKERKKRDTWSGVRDETVVGAKGKQDRTFGQMKLPTPASNIVQGVSGFLRSLKHLRNDFPAEMTKEQQQEFEETANSYARRAVNNALNPFYERASEIFQARKDGIGSYEQHGLASTLQDMVQAAQEFIEGGEVLPMVDAVWRRLDSDMIPPRTKDTIMARLQEAVQSDDPSVLEGEKMSPEEAEAVRREINSAKNQLGDQWQKANDQYVSHMLATVGEEIAAKVPDGTPLAVALLPTRVKERAHNELLNRLRDFEHGRLDQAFATEGEEAVDNPDAKQAKEGVATEDASGAYLDYTPRAPTPPVSAKEKTALRDALVTKQQLVPVALDKLREAYKNAKTETGKKMLADAAAVLKAVPEQLSLVTLQKIAKGGAKPVEIAQIIAGGREDPNLPLPPVKTPQTKAEREALMQADSMMGPNDLQDQETRYGSNVNAPDNVLRHRGERGYPNTPSVEQGTEKPVTAFNRDNTKPVGDLSGDIKSARADVREWQDLITDYEKTVAKERAAEKPNQSLIAATEKTIAAFQKRLADAKDRVAYLSEGKPIAAPEVAAERPKAEAVPSGRASNYAGKLGKLDLTTKEGQAQAREEIRKIAGDVGIKFSTTEEMGGAVGTYRPREDAADTEGHVITLAVNHYGGLGTAVHEAVHAIFRAIDPVDKRELRITLKSNIAVRARLLELTKDFPEVQHAIRTDPEEAAAYAYQFWKAGALSLKPESAHLFQKIEQLLHRAWQWVRGQASAEEIFKRISDGVYANGPDVAAQIIARQQSTRSGIQKVVNTATQKLEMLHSTLLESMDDRLREVGISGIEKLADKLYVRVGDRTNERGLAQAIPAMTKKWLNEFQQILGHDHEVAYEALRSIAEDRDASSPEAQAIREKLRGKDGDGGFLRKIWNYQYLSGMESLGRIKGYLPMQWSGDKIQQQYADFVHMLEGHRDEIEKLNGELKAKLPAAQQKDFVPMTPESIADMMANRNLKHAIPTGDVYDDRGVPTSWHSLDRVFGFLTNAERAPFVEDDLAGSMATYIKQSVRRAEFVHRFGENGEVLQNMKDAARKEGATDEHIKLVQDSIDNIYNVRYAHMDPDTRFALGAVQTYQNFRVLGLSLLSSVIDPLVLGVRTQEMGEAWKAYKHAIANIIPRKNKSELERFSEDIGAIERFGVADSITDLYGGYDSDGFVKKLNDKLFTYNGMNGLTRALRVFATGAGMRFIDKHAKAGAEGERMLAELGLSAGDIYRRANGELALTGEHMKELGMKGREAAAAAAKVQAAVNRFVDESVLHPNAMERPNWGSDPLWGLVFHLKQYMFSFQKIVAHKIWHEAQETGTMKPFLTAVPFIPIMGASQFTRDLIQHGGSIPADRGFLHYMISGLDRSGFQGPEDIPLDIATDLAKGQNPLSGNVVGPTADQLLGLLQAPTKGGYRALVEALPGQSVFKHYL